MRILYFFPHVMSPELERVAANKAPSERGYGLLELSRFGHEVAVADRRFKGRWAPVIRTLRRNSINFCDPMTLLELRGYDIIVVKDEFSSLLTLACKAAGRTIVYLDAMFDMPSGSWKRAAARLNVNVADGIVAYSQRQIDLWSIQLGVSPAKFKFLPYTIDLSFYRSVEPAARRDSRPYVLSVGRDLGRRFDELIEAMEGLGIDLKLITLPYLLRDVDTSRPWIQVLQYLSYPQLFQLYADAALIAIPLKEGLTYPSGIRALLEAMALGRPVVATRTPVLQEYVTEADGVCFVDSGNKEQLREVISRLVNDPAEQQTLADRARAVVHQRYGMDAFARDFESYLAASLEKPRV